MAPIQPPFPEPRYARKARAVIDFEAPTDLTINEPSTEGPTRVSGLPIDFGRVICCVNLTSSSVNGRVSLASQRSDTLVLELHFSWVAEERTFLCNAFGLVSKHWPRTIFRLCTAISAVEREAMRLSRVLPLCAFNYKISGLPELGPS